MSAPQSTIYICSGVRLNSRYAHSIYFADANAQTSYFAGKVVRTFSGNTYLRKSWSIKVEATMREARSWSYLYFQNGVGGKICYYFINNLEYKNDTTVELFLELDVLQTYMFDYDLLPSFVERQHVEDDTPGKHTQDEGLDPGEYVVESVDHVIDLNDLCILILTSVIPNGVSKETTVDAYGYLYDRVFSGLQLYAVNLNQWQRWAAQLENLSEWGKIDGIVNMWMYPKKLVQLGGESTWDDDDIAKVVRNVGNTSLELDPISSSTLDGYEVKNGKMLTYPYTFLYATNNNGASGVYRYERFNGSPSFRVVGALAPDAGCRMYPLNYNGRDAYAEGISLGAFPTCAWDADTYKLWLAQNQNQHDLTMATGNLKVAAGVVVAAGAALMGSVGAGVAGLGVAASGYSDVLNLQAMKADKAIEPPQARGTFSANINIANTRHTFSVLKKTVSAEYAKRIDDFFTMYGYRINSVHVPNRCAREAFTYVKTVGCHIAARLCNEDTVKIESIYDNGITWWRDGDQIGNYSIQNRTL